jgi:hypothetical protein
MPWRYAIIAWELKRLPSYCACGKQFTVDHAISCLKGGFVHQRHDELRDIFANLLDDVAYDVRVEPPLTPLAVLRKSSIWLK